MVYIRKLSKFYICNHIYFHKLKPLDKHQKFTRRWINPSLILSYFDELGIECIAENTSVEHRPIKLYRLGKGSLKVILWSQMHGNESTTTRALVDVIDVLKSKKLDIAHPILEKLQLYIVPVLNPDGAMRWTRNNANDVDLNRDALALSQPESAALFSWIDAIKPHFCFNLHDQRTFYNLKNTTTEALLSFLSPAMDVDRSVNELRLKSMAVINHIVTKSSYSGNIGRYYDDFNPQCFGDRLNMLGYPTLLFEAGQLGVDYNRGITRKAMTGSILDALYFLVDADFSEDKTTILNQYLSIPEMDKNSCDVLMKLVCNGEPLNEIEINYEEVLKNSEIKFIPLVKKITRQSDKTPRKTVVLESNKALLGLKVGDEITNVDELHI